MAIATDDKHRLCWRKVEPLHFKLRSVTLGMDEDGEPVTSAVVDATDAPAPTRKPIRGKNEVAIQALNDALRDHGTTRTGNCYPINRKVVDVDHWREACGVHGLTAGATDAAARMAFKRAKDKLKRRENSMVTARDTEQVVGELNEAVRQASFSVGGLNARTDLIDGRTSALERRIAAIQSKANANAPWTPERIKTIADLFKEYKTAREASKRFRVYRRIE